MFSQRFVKFVAIKLSAFFLPFVQAFKYYKQALSRLVKRKNNPQIWDAVSWELCTSQYSLGCLLQDYPPIKTTAQEEVIFVHNVFVFIFRAKHLYHWGHCFYASASRKILSSPRTSIYTLISELCSQCIHQQKWILLSPPPLTRDLTFYKIFLLYA